MNSNLYKSVAKDYLNKTSLRSYFFRSSKLFHFRNQIVFNGINLNPFLLKFSSRTLNPLVSLSQYHYHIVFYNILLRFKTDYLSPFHDISEKGSNTFLFFKGTGGNYLGSVLNPNGVLGNRAYKFFYITFIKGFKHFLDYVFW